MSGVVIRKDISVEERNVILAKLLELALGEDDEWGCYLL